MNKSEFINKMKRIGVKVDEVETFLELETNKQHFATIPLYEKENYAVNNYILSELNHLKRKKIEKLILEFVKSKSKIQEKTNEISNELQRVINERIDYLKRNNGTYIKCIYNQSQEIEIILDENATEIRITNIGE